MLPLPASRFDGQTGTKCRADLITVTCRVASQSPGENLNSNIQDNLNDTLTIPMDESLLKVKERIQNSLDDVSLISSIVFYIRLTE